MVISDSIGGVCSDLLGGEINLIVADRREFIKVFKVCFYLDKKKLLDNGYFFNRGNWGLNSFG